MHIDPRDLPELFNRWLTAIAELLTGSKAGKPALKVDGLRSGYKQRKEQLLQRLADNEAIRAILIKHRARLLEQLQQARLTTSDLRLGENRLKMGYGNDGKSGAPATQALPVQAPDAKASPPGESFSMPEVELDGEGELDQDISSDQVSELLDIDENGDAIVAQNDRVQIRERAGKGVERVITQVSSRVYEGSTLISKSDHISRLDLDAGNIVKVRFSDGSIHDAVFSGKYAKPESNNRSRAGISSGSINVSPSSVPHKKPGSSSQENASVSSVSSTSSASNSSQLRPIIYFPGSTPFAVSAEAITANFTKKLSVEGAASQLQEAPQMPRIATDFKRTTGPL